MSRERMNAMLEAMGSQVRVEENTPISTVLTEVTSLLLARIAALEALVTPLERPPGAG